MSRPWIAIVALLAVVPLGGCKLSTNPGSGHFDVSLALASSSLAPDEPLRFTLAVTNTGNANGVLRFSKGCGINFVVRDGIGVIYDDNRMSLKLCGGDPPPVEFAPGQTRTWTGAWDQGTPRGRPAPGDYRIEVQLLTAPKALDAEAPFSIRSAP